MTTEVLQLAGTAPRSEERRLFWFSRHCAAASCRATYNRRSAATQFAGTAPRAEGASRCTFPTAHQRLVSRWATLVRPCGARRGLAIGAAGAGGDGVAVGAGGGMAEERADA